MIYNLYSTYMQQIQVFWDVTLCHWISSSWCFEQSQCLHVQGLAVQEACLTLKTKKPLIFQNIGKCSCSDMIHIPHTLNLLQHHVRVSLSLSLSRTHKCLRVIRIQLLDLHGNCYRYNCG